MPTEYLYISDTKVDVLLGGTPTVKRKEVATRLGFDWRLLSGTREALVETSETGITRLKAAIALVEEDHGIGQPGDASPWFRGTGALYWGLSEPTAAERTAVLFIGEIDGRDILLGGSPHHLVGHTRPPQAHRSRSLLYGVYELLFFLAGGEGVPDRFDEDQALGLAKRAVRAAPTAGLVRQELQFVARAYLSDDTTTVGSPLCVALV